MQLSDTPWKGVSMPCAESIAEPHHADSLSGGARPSDRMPSGWRADLGLDCGAIERSEEPKATGLHGQVARAGIRSANG